MNLVDKLIKRYGMEEHPEGGYYSVIYQSDESIDKSALPERYSGSRKFAAGIYYLLPAGEKSVFHRLKSDELWFHLAGGTLELYLLDEDTGLEKLYLSKKVNTGHHLHGLVPRGTWMAARPAEGVDFSLVSCVVMPGFEFDDFELAQAKTLIRRHPGQEQLIRELT
ncbi:MAG: cupin domain-containing protein [bacterium]